ncbi:MAG: class I SAM-dependent methyltransferase [Chitinophagaceae bacterium]
MKTALAAIFFLICTCNAGCNAEVTGYSQSKASPDGTGKFYFGREIARIMDAGGGDWLERNERQREENTALAIRTIQLGADAVVADIGAGTGYYSFRLAGKVPRGKVYAVEVQDAFIRLLNTKKAALKDSVVEVIKGATQSPNLPNNSIDLAIMVDVYHELEFPAEMLQALGKALKPNGKILFIEYRGEDPSIPIKTIHKTTVAQLNRELGANGFRLSQQEEMLPIQHFLLYEKK